MGKIPFAGMRRIIMVKKSIKIELSSGLEARPAAMLLGTGYKSVRQKDLPGS